MAFAQVSPTAAAVFEPTLWYDIDRDGIVTVNIIRAEMGQHVGTALARIVADELEVDWASVRLRYVDTDPKWGVMVTGGSWSVWQSFPYLSQAGAAGRMALIDEGARLLRVDRVNCIAWVIGIVSVNMSMVLTGNMDYLWINMELVILLCLSYELERMPLRQFIK